MVWKFEVKQAGIFVESKTTFDNNAKAKRVLMAQIERVSLCMLYMYAFSCVRAGGWDAGIIR